MRWEDRRELLGFGRNINGKELSVLQLRKRFQPKYSKHDSRVPFVRLMFDDQHLPGHAKFEFRQHFKGAKR